MACPGPHPPPLSPHTNTRPTHPPACARRYVWQMVNCGFTAAYSLYMRGAMDRVAEHTSDGKKLSEFSMVRERGMGCV